MTMLAGILAAGLLRLVPAAPDSFPRLVSPAWVATRQRQHEVVLIHVDRSRAGYDSSHAAGARFATPADFTTSRGATLTELPSPDSLAAWIERLGVSNRSEVVLYGDALGAARLFMTLEYLGHDRVAILDGGAAAWRAAGLPIEAGAPRPAPAGHFRPVVRPDVVASRDWVNAHLDDPSVGLLDARSAAEYSGEQPEEGVSRPGHLPGALLLDWHTLMDGGRFKSADDLRGLLRTAGLKPGQTAVTYCRVGTRASLLYFALRYLGQPVRLYDGSLNEWSADPELPVVRGTAPAPVPTEPKAALWETVVVKREATTDLAAYQAHLASGWTASRARAKALGLVLDYRILVGQAMPDDLMPWDVILVTVYRDDAARREVERDGEAETLRIEGPTGRRLARRQYVTVLREP